MFTFFEPSETEIDDFFTRQKDLPFSYLEIGASKDRIPDNYPVNHHRIRIGNGAQTFDRAKKAIDDWTMYKLDWTRVYPPKTPINIGESVCIVVNHGFCWSINSCRIIYVLNEYNESTKRYGFAFGTLPGHSETGEERFTVEWNRADDSVFYELLSFARPQHILAHIGFPFVTFFQRKFARDSGESMLNAVSKNSNPAI
jgi:uncharacterized protein (UPF0548 family)